MKATEIDNPAWDYIESNGLYLPDRKPRLLGGDLPRWPEYDPDDPDALKERWKDYVDHRRRVTSRWAWAVPDPKAIQFIVDVLDGRPLVEVGAGNGYWASMLSQMGVDVIAYDRSPLGVKGTWFNLENGKAWVLKSGM